MGFIFFTVFFLTGAGVFPARAKDNLAHDETAIVAGGCFWCIQAAFQNVPGVISAVAGYTGGTKPYPTYAEVSSGRTGYYEAVEVTFDPAKISYEDILNIFWRDIDPTDPGGQFSDRGSQYRTAIFYVDREQRRIAEASKKKLAASGMFKKPIVTKILKVRSFYPAEEHHQDYAQKHPVQYELYHVGSGREGFVDHTWKGRPNVCPLRYHK